MSKKKIQGQGGLVYSTDPDFKIPTGNLQEEETLQAGKQQLRVRLDTRNRGGKAVTLIQGFTGISNDLEDLGKKLKSVCGTGGSVKDGEIIVQGDNRDKIMQWLQKNGYSAAKRI